MVNTSNRMPTNGRADIGSSRPAPISGRYWRLILHKTYADLRAQTAKTYLGIAWWIIDPLLYMAVFYIVFAVLLRNRTGDFVSFLLVGLVFWRWFHASISNGAQSIILGRGLMQQIYLPKFVFVAVNLLSDLIKFGFVLALLLVFLWFRGYEVTTAYFALPVVMLLQFLLVVGATLLVAAIIPLLPDLKYLVDNGLVAMMFLSGIFFDGKTLDVEQQSLLYLNPLARLIDAYRDVLMYQRWPDLTWLWPCAVWGIGMLLISTWLLTVLDKKYPKIVKAR